LPAPYSQADTESRLSSTSDLELTQKPIGLIVHHREAKKGDDGPLNKPPPEPPKPVYAPGSLEYERQQAEKGE
jgi:hypothetical protein